MNNPTLKEIASFLNGASALDGVWFGESHPDPKHVGMYWWRPILVKAIEESQASPPSGGEPVAYLHTVKDKKARPDDTDLALSFHADSFPFSEIGWVSVKHEPLYTSPRVVDVELREAAERVVKAFECYGQSRTVIANEKGRRECEASMAALKAALGEGK